MQLVILMSVWKDWKYWSEFKSPSLSIVLTRFFYKQRFFSTQPQCCFTFPQIELQILLRCWLIHINIIKSRQIFFLLYLCSCLDLCLFLSHLCDLLFIFIFVFMIVNRVISSKNTCLLFAYGWYTYDVHFEGGGGEG